MARARHLCLLSARRGLQPNTPIDRAGTVAIEREGRPDAQAGLLQGVHLGRGHLVRVAGYAAHNCASAPAKAGSSATSLAPGPSLSPPWAWLFPWRKSTPDV